MSRRRGAEVSGVECAVYDCRSATARAAVRRTLSLASRCLATRYSLLAIGRRAGRLTFTTHRSCPTRLPLLCLHCSLVLPAASTHSYRFALT
ncbi:hypothetical protein J6590_105953, partial [Homalodisca vitripennis]